MVTDELSPLLMSGRVQVRAGVERFTKTGALLKDGTSIQDVDVVICATGYRPRYTFLDESIIPSKFFISVLKYWTLSKSHYIDTSS